MRSLRSRLLRALARPLASIGAWLIFGLLSTAAAVSEPLPSSIAGGVLGYVIQPGDHLTKIGARFGIEASTLAQDNGISAKSVIKPGLRLKVDNRHIVPDSIAEGILINIPQRMLFLFGAGELLARYPVGLGKPSWPTPTGSFKIVQLEKDKTWCVPESIQEEMRRAGRVVRSQVPPGPDNPLGGYWVGLTLAGYGIHGTTAPASVYQFQSHGCIRLHSDDIAALYPMLWVGMPGRLVYAPVLFARLDDGRIFLEVHRDVYNKRIEPIRFVQAIAERYQLSASIDWSRVAEVVASRDGTAREVGSTRGKGEMQ